MSEANWPFGDLRPRAYRTIAIDPPWKFSAGTKGRPQHYARMTDDEIAELPVKELCHPEGSHIFLWVTSPKAFHIPAIVKAWGLRYSGRAFIWVKTHSTISRAGEPLFFHRNSLHIGTGFTTRKNAEDCLLLKIGKPVRLQKNIHEIIISPRREHSRKPDEFYRRAEAYSLGPYADVFSRESRPGWETFGNETGKFDEAAA
jgi:N6-adenosine-specific RNA methylase IME4